MNTGRNNYARRAGVTFVELLVSIVILIILIGAFNLILTQAQKVVSNGQATINANTTSKALVDVCRSDLRRVTPNGFLCITSSAALNNGGTPQLFLSTAGPADSSGSRGTGALTGYGLCLPDPALPPSILWRGQWALNNQSPASRADNFFQLDLAGIQVLTRQGADALVTGLQTTTDADPKDPAQTRYVPHSIFMPPSDLNEINYLWKVFSQGCPVLSIMWSDGSVQNGIFGLADHTDDILWYGLIPNATLPQYDVVHKLETVGEVRANNVWTTRGIAQPGFIQYNGNAGVNPPIYRALWTHHDPNNWPKAVKFQFWTNQNQETDKVRAATGGNTIPVYHPERFTIGSFVQPLGAHSEYLYRVTNVDTSPNNKNITVTAWNGSPMPSPDQGLCVLYQYEVICPVGQ